jgi:hypothetical protein
MAHEFKPAIASLAHLVAYPATNPQIKIDDAKKKF